MAAFQGIIYSDIGTSPLYTLNGVWPSSGPVPSKEDVIGGLSAIIWALTLLPLIKYVMLSRPLPLVITNSRPRRCSFACTLARPKVVRSY